MISSTTSVPASPREGIVKVFEATGWVTTSMSGAVTTFRLATAEEAADFLNDDNDDASGETPRPPAAHTFGDGASFLDAVAEAAEAALAGEAAAPEELMAAAARVYGSVPVAVSLAEEEGPDGAAALPVPPPEDDPSMVVVDLWAPAHLALMLRHERAAQALLAFHARHAAATLAALLEDGDEPGSAGRLVVATRPDFGHCVLLLGDHEAPPAGAGAEEEEAAARRNAAAADAEEARLQDQMERLCPRNVLDALRSFVSAAVHALDRGHEGHCFALQQLATFAASQQQQQQQARRAPPTLLVDALTCSETCGGGDLSLFRKLFRASGGLLCPVFKAKRQTDLQGARYGSRPASALSTPRGGPRPASAAALAPFWFCCAPQEAQQMTFYAAWLAQRRRAAITDCTSQSARAAALRAEGRVVAAAGRSSSGAARHPPRGALWSLHMLVLTRLLSKDCSLEDFIDVATEAGARQGADAVDALPGAVSAALAGSLMVASLLGDAPAACEAIARKTDTLLVDAGGAASAPRRYVLARGLMQGERFEELWIGETTFASEKKFMTRAEFLYYVAVEVVATAAERVFADMDREAAKRGEQQEQLAARKAAAQAALTAWIKMWREFFERLHADPFVTRRHSPSRGGSSSAEATPHAGPAAAPCAVPAIDGAAGAEAAVGGDEVDDAKETLETIGRVLEALPLRLENGKPPLPAVHAAMYPAEGGDSTGDGDGAAPSIDKEFQHAQTRFGQEAGKHSNEVKLKFYGLFKQATAGDVTGSRPWVMDPVGRAKWDAWSSRKGMSQLDAKHTYVNEFKTLQAQAEKS